MLIAIIILSSILCILLVLLLVGIILLKKGWIKIGIPTKNADNVLLQELDKEFKKDATKVL